MLPKHKRTYKKKTVTGYIKEIKTKSGYRTREDLNTAYVPVSAEEMCTGNEFQIKDALIKKEYQ